MAQNMGVRKVEGWLDERGHFHATKEAAEKNSLIMRTYQFMATVGRISGEPYPAKDDIAEWIVRHREQLRLFLETLRGM